MRKKVLITGGASGLGKSLSLSFAKDGYDILLFYNNSGNEAILLKDILEKDYSINVTLFKCNLKNEKEIEITLNKIDNVDVLVNNAAVEIDNEFNDKTKEDFLYTLEVNLIAPFLISRTIGNKMKQKGHGKIINIASNDASKTALINLTFNLAKEFAPFVNVNAIAPGWIKTDKIIEIDRNLDNKFIEEESKNILLNRFAEEEEICNLVLFLASDKANYINSEVIRIDGGSV